MIYSNKLTDDDKKHSQQIFWRFQKQFGEENLRKSPFGSFNV